MLSPRKPWLWALAASAAASTATTHAASAFASPPRRPMPFFENQGCGDTTKIPTCSSSVRSIGLRGMSSGQTLQEQIISDAARKLLEKEDSTGSYISTKTQNRAPPLRTAALASDIPGCCYSYYIREGKRSEITEIADVLMQSFHSDSQPSFDSYIRRYKYNHLKMCFDAMDESDRGLFVACAVPSNGADSGDELIVGFCSVDGRTPDPSCKIEFLTPYTLAGTSPRPYLSDLGVSPSHRRRGIGEKLVRTCEEWTHRRGYGTLYLKVDQKNAGGFALYSGMGYRRTKLPWGMKDAAASSVAGRDTTMLMEKTLTGKDETGGDRGRKRRWIKKQIWRPVKERVNWNSAIASIGTGPLL